MVGQSQTFRLLHLDSVNDTPRAVAGTEPRAGKVIGILGVGLVPQQVQLEAIA
jgi:hypothetical protein